MPLIKSGKQAIVDAINAYASLGLKPEHLDFGTPTVLEVSDDASKNTVVKVSALQSAPVRGATVVQYNRQPFSKYFTEPDGVNPMVITTPTTANTSHDLLPGIRQFLGIELTEDDLVLTVIDHDAMTVRLEATEESLGWLGGITAKLVPGDGVLADAFLNTSLDSFYAYPNFNTLLGQAPVYSYRYDFSDYMSLLRTVSAGNLPLDKIAAMMKTVTGNDWQVARSPSDYNLTAAVFRYNGLNNNPLYSGNRNYSRVLVLELAFYSLKLGGLLFIHYNA